MKRRSSKDKVVNREGRALLTMTEKRGWYIMNGNTDGDHEGQYTHIGYNGETVIDYVIANSESRDRIQCLRIGERTESDHQPLEITLTDKRVMETQKNEVREVYQWHKENVSAYIEKIARVRMGQRKF